MLTSLANVHEEFFKVFRPALTVPKGTGSISIPVRYARESKNDRAELKEEVYPQVTILDRMPEFDGDWADSYKKRYGGFHRSSSSSPLNRAFEFREPILFSCKYDVSVFTRDALDKWAVDDYFKQKFRSSGRFIFNKDVIATPQLSTTVGDVVSYTVSGSDISRSDGIHEQNYLFTVRAMVAFTGVEVELLEELLINIT